MATRRIWKPCVPPQIIITITTWRKHLTSRRAEYFFAKPVLVTDTSFPTLHCVNFPLFSSTTVHSNHHASLLNSVVLLTSPYRVNTQMLNLFTVKVCFNMSFYRFCFSPFHPQCYTLAQSKFRVNDQLDICSFVFFQFQI